MGIDFQAFAKGFLDRSQVIMDENSEEAKELGIHQFINATKEEIELITRLLENSIKYGFSERECNIIYRLSAFDLLTASESKSAIMLMAQKLGNIPIPKEDNE